MADHIVHEYIESAGRIEWGDLPNHTLFRGRSGCYEVLSLGSWRVVSPFLTALYGELNVRFWGGQLPAYPVFGFGYEPQVWTEFNPTRGQVIPGSSIEIGIDPDNDDPRSPYEPRKILLHEMAHVAVLVEEGIVYRDLPTHGPPWIREMRRVQRMGEAWAAAHVDMVIHELKGDAIQEVEKRP